MTQSHVVSWIMCSCDISTIALVQVYKDLWEWWLALMRFVHPTQHEGGKHFSSHVDVIKLKNGLHVLGHPLAWLPLPSSHLPCWSLSW